MTIRSRVKPIPEWQDAAKTVPQESGFYPAQYADGEIRMRHWSARLRKWDHAKFNTHGDIEYWFPIPAAPLPRKKHEET